MPKDMNLHEKRSEKKDAHPVMQAVVGCLEDPDAQEVLVEACAVPERVCRGDQAAILAEVDGDPAGRDVVRPVLGSLALADVVYFALLHRRRSHFDRAGELRVLVLGSIAIRAKVVDDPVLVKVAKGSVSGGERSEERSGGKEGVRKC